MILRPGLVIGLLSLLLCGPTDARADQYLVRLGMTGERQENWDRLARYLSVESGHKVRIETGLSFDQIQSRLASGQLEGVIISPYRYVILSAHYPGLRLIARLKRGGTHIVPGASLAGAALPEGPESDYAACPPAALTPHDSYASVLIRARTTGTDTVRSASAGEGTYRLGVRGAHSTSSFLFPAQHLARSGQGQEPAAMPIVRQVYSWQELDTTFNAWRQPAAGGATAPTAITEQIHPDTAEALDRSIRDYFLVQELGARQPRIDFAGISSHWLEGYPGNKDNFEEVARSQPIPYDPVLLSDSVPRPVADKLQLAFHSTRGIREEIRDLLFRITGYSVPAPDGDGRQVICRRSPDVHSFVPASHSDYEMVREWIVNLWGGVKLRLALSRDAHWNWDRDKQYFRRLQALLLGRGAPSGSAAGADFPVLLDYALYEGDFAQLRAAIERGEYHVAELNAAEAGRVLHERTATLVGSAYYRDKRIQRESYPASFSLDDVSSYRAVLFSRGPLGGIAGFVENIGNSCLALTGGDSSGVNRAALEFFAVGRETPLPASRLQYLDDAAAVIEAVRTGAGESGNCRGGGGADYGLLAEFDFIRTAENKRVLSQFHALPLGQVSLTNAMMLFSRRYAPLDEDFQPDGSISDGRVRSLLTSDGVDVSEQELARRRLALKKFKAVVADSRPIYVDLGEGETGFLGYAPVDKSVARAMALAYGQYARNYIALIASSLLLLLLGTGLIVWRAYRRRAGTDVMAGDVAGASGPTPEPGETAPGKGEPAADAGSASLAVFLSYRRKDAGDAAGRIWDRLILHYGVENVFKDVHTIRAGQDFRKVIDDSISRADVFLAIIGPDWLGEGEAGSRIGERRDVVRLEVASALSREMPVIPLLIGGATIPQADELPPELQELVDRSGLEIRPDPDFDHDMQRLISALDEWRQDRHPDSP